jgi:hypothetical protein
MLAQRHGSEGAEGTFITRKMHIHIFRDSENVGTKRVHQFRIPHGVWELATRSLVILLTAAVDGGLSPLKAVGNLKV